MKSIKRKALLKRELERAVLRTCLNQSLMSLTHPIRHFSFYDIGICQRFDFNLNLTEVVRAHNQKIDSEPR